jgi:hypothetical protein
MCSTLVYETDDIMGNLRNERIYLEDMRIDDGR